MNNSIPQFEKFCLEITKKQTYSIDEYLTKHCPIGEAAFFRNYMFRLYWLASRSKSKKIVELGCIPGGSTIPLLWAVEKNDGHLWSCDINTPPITIPFCDYLDLSRRTTIGSTPASFLGKNWSFGEVDFIYLDTSHEYNETIAEINAWLPHLKEGGLFVFHDTEIYKTHVFKAIADVMINSSSLFELHHWPDCYGHVVLQRFCGEQTSTSFMRPSRTAKKDSVTQLLIEALRG